MGPATSTVTAGVRRLVDEAHRGNIREAAALSGLPYATLRDLYVGRSANPGIETLARLGEPYRLTADWFLAPPDTRGPITAIAGILPPDPEIGGTRLGRTLSIPLAAWPLARVFLDLESYLTTLPPAADRPVLGGVRDPNACRQRLTAFLLTPLLEAAEAGGMRVLGADPPFRGTSRPSKEEWEAWLEALRDLGAFWERALAPMLAVARRVDG